MRIHGVVTDNEVMNTDNETTLPLGARFFPGVDLTLWLAIIVTALLVTVGITGIVIAATH